MGKARAKAVRKFKRIYSIPSRSELIEISREAGEFKYEKRKTRVKDIVRHYFPKEEI